MILFAVCLALLSLPSILPPTSSDDNDNDGSEYSEYSDYCPQSTALIPAGRLLERNTESQALAQIC